MFWSLILEPSKRYSSTVTESFHLSMATLDLSTVKNDQDLFPVQLEVDEQKLILCNLSKSLCPQVNLDLIFRKGSSVTFFTGGKATIHLTGYLAEIDDLEGYDSEEESSDEEVPQLLKNKLKTNKTEDKNKLQSANANKTESSMKRKSEPANEVAKKKAKPSLPENDDDEDDSDDDMSDLDVSDLGGEDLEEDSDLEDETLDDSNDEDDDDDEDDSDEDEASKKLSKNASKKPAELKTQKPTAMSDEDDDDEDDEDDEDDDSDDDDSDEEEVDQKPVQTPKKKQDTKAQTPNDKSAQSKTPTSVKKDGKQNNLNKSLVNGATPKQTPKGEKNKGTPQQQGKTPNKELQGTPQKKTLSGGVVIQELKPGNGAVAKPGKLVFVYYTGRLQKNNRVFDEHNNGSGFKFRLGKGEVIKGWDVGLADMKVGSKRRITCPPSMAYGAKGAPPAVPPNSTLVFDVELKAVN